MNFIAHRLNSIAQLDAIRGTNWGAEIDLRSLYDKPRSLHLAHDPWTSGEDFEAWLKTYSEIGSKGYLILNTKEDGLEERCLELLNKFQIENYFFLDTALPTLVKCSTKLSNPNFAIRLSKFESLETALNFSGRVKWLWVDCFNGEPVELSMLETLRSAFRVCLVSPELQGKSLDALEAFREISSQADAICTKDPTKWIQSGILPSAR